MAKGKIYNNLVSTQDPNFQAKIALISSNNYLHDQTRQDKERFYNKVYFTISLLTTVIASFFIEYWGGVVLITLTIVLGIFIAFGFFHYRKQRKEFWKNREKMKESFDSFGLEWRE